MYKRQLWETGPDVIGWLNLPDTVINYPVTQAEDNEYYLRHLYDGTYNKPGCLFADYENKADFSAKTVASKLFVSEASLSRFAQKCGYRGYREFIYQYEKNFVEKKETMAGNTLMILNAYQELLNLSLIHI